MLTEAEPITTPFRKTSARRSAALTTTETGPCGDFSGVQENASSLTRTPASSPETSCGAERRAASPAFGDHDGHSGARQAIEKLGEAGRHPDAAMRCRITWQMAGMERDPVPGEPLHVRHRRAVIFGRMMDDLLLEDGKYARRSAVSGAPGRDGRGADRHAVAIEGPPAGSWRFTMISMGPSGATSGAQTYSPACSFETIATTEPELMSTCWALIGAAAIEASATAAPSQQLFILLAGLRRHSGGPCGMSGSGPGDGYSLGEGSLNGLGSGGGSPAGSSNGASFGCFCCMGNHSKWATGGPPFLLEFSQA